MEMEILSTKYNYEAKYIYIDNNNELDLDYYTSDDYLTLDECEASIETYINKLKEGKIDNIHKLLGYNIYITSFKMALIEGEVWSNSECIKSINSIDKLNEKQLRIFNI
jgi:hypothetical protein